MTIYIQIHVLRIINNYPKTISQQMAVLPLVPSYGHLIFVFKGVHRSFIYASLFWLGLVELIHEFFSRNFRIHIVFHFLVFFYGIFRVS